MMRDAGGSSSPLFDETVPPIPRRLTEVLATGAPRAGEFVRCDVLGAGPCRPCVWCSSTIFVITAGKGPHRAGLRCTGCGRAGRWLPKRLFGGRR